MATLDEVRRFYAEEIRAVSDIQCDALIDAVAKVPRGGVAIYPCASARDAAAQDQLRELFKRSDFTVQSLRRDAHERDATCGMHLADYCLSSLPPE
jgi:hypothetical protein